MRLFHRIKYFFFSRFREFLIYHHNSLEFRAKLFALVITANENIPEKIYEYVQKAGMKIYNDENRANALRHTTYEIVQKVIENNGLDIDLLALDIQQELKDIPRYSYKIDTKILQPLLEYNSNPDTISYQENILEFLDKLKEEFAPFKHQNSQV